MTVTARAISCARGGEILFSDLSFSVSSGESLLLRGPNGIGKSSLLRMIAGLLPCFHGELECSAKFALADEHLALDQGIRLRNALAFWAHMDGADGNETDRAMAHFALAGLADIPVRMLSTGQRKRAILARTMASGAELWLLDEPGNGLDAASLSRLGTAMDAHLAGGGMIIAASHFDLPHPFTHKVNLAEFAQ